MHRGQRSSHLIGWGCLLLLCVSVPVSAQTWDLVWRDEFDGPAIDLSMWTHEVNGWGGGNNELQYYTDRATNSFIENGNLVIQALDETYTGPDGTRDFTSARLRTLNKGDWTYGRIEARMKLPYGQGLWPAFWMLPTDWVYGGWAASGEIDIMELVGHQPNVLHGTIHYHGEWPDNWSSGNSWTLPSGDFSDDFHVFALEWEAGVMRWYVDGIHYSTKTSWDTTSGAPFPAPFDERFHILLNVAVGGNWPGPPNGTTVFPQRMEVDYVRVYTDVSGSPWGTPVDIPAVGTARIEAEDYDVGGPGVAYSDSGTGNTGGQYRSDDVDIQATTDTGGGYNVGWTAAGEWLEYPIDVQQAGLFDLDLRVASQVGGAQVRVFADGLDVTGPIAIGNTGGWQAWTTLTAANVPLPSGEAQLRLAIDGGECNINWLELTWTGSAAGATNCYLALSDFATGPGIVATGSYLDTHVQDGIHEKLREGSAGGGSQLRHTWDFLLGADGIHVFFVDAYRLVTVDGDEFVFEYSTDGTNYTPMVVISSTSASDAYQSYLFPEDVSGTLLIRASDTDSTPGGIYLDPLMVDHMKIQGEPYPAPDRDRDGDGLPDVWEIEHFQTLTGAVASVDSDGDTGSNEDEYVADTDPWDPASFLTITNMVISSSVTVLAPASTNREYYLQKSSDMTLGPAGWLELPPPVIPGSTSLTLTDTNPSPDAAYRIRVAVPATP